jgi:drug/metabolite transporter (DMT)-like permease
LISAALVFALMAVATKVAAERLPGAQVAFIRFVIGLASCALARVWVPMRARNKLGLVMRGAYGGAAGQFYFLAIAHLPVGIATLLNYTAPVFTEAKQDNQKHNKSAQCCFAQELPLLLAQQKIFPIHN